jgi:alkylation response protein AidB-like acyl-CoA dehydrogenase
MNTEADLRRPSRAGNENGVSREKLLGSVEEIRPILVAECEAEDRQGHLSRATADALYDVGILGMKAPEVLGGGEADLCIQYEVIEAISRINPAAGWCTMVGATSIALPGAFLSDEGIAVMFGNGRMPRGAVVVMPTARAARIDGGFLLNGRWAFASGVQHAGWITAQAPVTSENDTAPALHMFVFPAQAAQLHDNWQVLGLRGTGSCDISVEELFVPAVMAWNSAEQRPRRGGPLYHLGLPAFVAYEHAAFATGLARRALDLLTETAVNKRRGYGPGAVTLADRSAVQRLIGHSELRLRAARGLALEIYAEANRAASRDKPLPPQLALQTRTAAVFCTEVALDIISQAFRYSGAAAIYEKSMMQRCLRDISVAAQHLMVSEVAYELLGKTHLGFDSVNPMA